MMADLKELRSRIDEIDEEIVRLFQERMDVAVEIGQHKQENGLPVFDPAREREKLHALSGQAKKGREADITALYSLIFELSRAAQERVVCPEAFRQI